MDLVSVKRPGFGTVGQKIQVYANHFKVNFPKQGYFYHYDVSIELIKEEKPKADREGDSKIQKKKKEGGRGGQAAAGAPAKINKELKKRIWNLFKSVNTAPEGLFHKIIPVFDGEKNLYTMRELNIAQGGNMSAIVEVPADPEGGARKGRVTVQPCRDYRTSWGELSQVIDEATHLAAGQRPRPVPVSIITCINTVFREAAIATQNKVAAGRSFYWRGSKEECPWLGGGLECWPGLYSSVRPCQWKMTLNLDVANTAFYGEQRVLDYLCDVLKLDHPRDFNDRDRRNFERDIKGIKIEHNVDNPPSAAGVRRCRVTKLSKLGADKESFMFEGKKMTIQEYFSKHKGTKLEFPFLPCLEVGTKGSLLPMEVCKIFGGQKVQRKLNEEQTAVMVKHCAQRAPHRMDRVTVIRDKIMNYDNSKQLKEFGISLEKKMSPVNARVLPTPVMGQSGDKGIVPIEVDKIQGTWEARNVRFVEPRSLRNWIIVNLDQRCPERILTAFIKELISSGRGRGMSISQPEFYGGRFDARNPDFPSIFRDIANKYKGSEPPLDMIMVIFPYRSPFYADVKKGGDIVHGIPTQCILAKNLTKNMDRGMGQYAGNVLLKINVKLGGINSQVNNLSPVTKNFEKLMDRFINKPTIIFGCDVTHPSPGEGSNRPSIAAIVASFDRRFTQYGARVRAQGHRKEIVSDLRDMVKELMIEFKIRNKGKEPQRIIFYRDGVSEGQYMQVMIEELSAVQQACKAIAPNEDYKPPITYVIVGKRHHTRLFPLHPIPENDRRNRAGNVAPGTITDRDICHFSEFDFFLCSHFGIQGTSRPAHYVVLYDDADFSADEIQLFSYYLTYVYARCNRSVSIPAPVYYAHHVAFRARYHLEDRNAIETASSFSGDSIASADLETMNRKIKVHEKISGMYFA